MISFATDSNSSMAWTMKLDKGWFLSQACRNVALSCVLDCRCDARLASRLRSSSVYAMGGPSAISGCPLAQPDSAVARAWVRNSIASFLTSAATSRVVNSSDFMGRSFLGWLSRDIHFTGLDRPAHFPRSTSHALPCSAFNRPPCAAGLDTTQHLRNCARHSAMGGRGLRGFLGAAFVHVAHGALAVPGGSITTLEGVCHVAHA